MARASARDIAEVRSGKASARDLREIAARGHSAARLVRKTHKARRRRKGH